MPVFVDPDGTIAYPSHRCVACGNLLLRVAGLKCNECLRHAGLLAGQSPDPKPKLAIPVTCVRPEYHPWGCHCGNIQKCPKCHYVHAAGWKACPSCGAAIP